MRRPVTVLLGLAILMAAAAPVRARTLPLVTGGATDVVPGLNVTVNALLDEGKAEYKGKILYDYEMGDLHLLADVACVNVDGTQATVTGPVRDDPNMWLIFRLDDMGESGDRITVVFGNESQAATHCLTAGGGGVTVTDGNFQIHNDQDA